MNFNPVYLDAELLTILRPEGGVNGVVVLFDDSKWAVSIYNDHFTINQRGIYSGCLEDGKVKWDEPVAIYPISSGIWNTHFDLGDLGDAARDFHANICRLGYLVFCAL